ncbi:hypothetical protein ZWY2020_006086 [Hordeum vulgare]|nr:hypothetical protein ZWY2020_006086 [Hordeum vulgare]
MPPDDHMREQPIAPSLMTSITKGNMQDLHRPCPSHTTTERPSSSSPGLAPPQLRVQSNKATHGRPPRTRRKEPTTKVHAAARAPLNAIIIAKHKLAAHLSKPCGEDAATHGEATALHKSSSHGRLRDDVPKEEKDARMPSSPSHAEEEHTSMMMLPRKITTPAGAASDGDQSKDYFWSCAEHLPPPTATHQPPIAKATSN